MNTPVDDLGNLLKKILAKIELGDPDDGPRNVAAMGLFIQENRDRIAILEKEERE
jgi:hypothetical protein